MNHRIRPRALHRSGRPDAGFTPRITTVPRLAVGQIEIGWKIDPRDRCFEGPQRPLAQRGEAFPERTPIETVPESLEVSRPKKDPRMPGRDFLKDGAGLSWNSAWG